MDFFEASRKRRSYRGDFLADPVSRKDLEKIVQAGLEAPSGCNSQTVSFAVIESPEAVKKVQAIPGGNKALQNGRAYILCIIDKDPPPVTGNLSFQVEDCAAATENILLAMTALGYAGVWIDGWLRRDGRADRLAEIASIPMGKVIRIIVPAGKPAEPFGHPEKKPFEEQVTFI